MLRRIAANLYWLTRYLERAEWRARLLDVNYRLLVENPPEAKDEWRPLLGLTGESDLFAEHYDAYDERSILAFFIFDPHNRSSIASCIEYARENGRAARNRISPELWLEINTLHLEARRWTSEMVLSSGLMPFFSELREHFYKISGAMQSTLPRDISYDFLSLGKWLEAAENVARILDTSCHLLMQGADGGDSPLNLSHWVGLLRSASALESYRHVYGNSIKVEHLVQFMLFDRSFPRAARFCLDRLEIALNRIANASPPRGQDSAESLAASVPASYALSSRLRIGNAAAAIAAGLHEYLLGIQAGCAKIGDEISRSYFKYE